MLTNNFSIENGYTHLVTPESMEIIRQCKFYKSCSAPFCPLDIYQDMVRPLYYKQGFHKCKLLKRYRKEIAKNYEQLVYGGLTPDEWDKIVAWRNTPKSKKELITLNLNSKVEKQSTIPS